LKRFWRLPHKQRRRVTVDHSLRQTIPSYWLLLDSGATVSVSQDDSLMINIVMSSDLVLGLSEHCRATAKGEIFAMTFIKKDGKWIRKHFRSGRRNCLLVPDSSRPIMSSIQLDKQGHQPHAFGNNPGLVLFGDEGFIPFVREEETGFYLMPCMPPSFKDPDVYSEEILNLNYAVDDGRFEYSSKLEEQISVQALPDRVLKSKLKRGLKLSIAFKKPIVKGTNRKNCRVSTQRSIDSEVTDNGKCQSSSSATPLKNKRKGITEKLRSQILRKYPPSKVQQLHAKFGHIDLRTLIKFKRNNKIKALGLPPRLLREYIDHQCPICHTMKRRHPKRPSSLSNAEKCNFKP
jgi:hypothetical protein